jgi:hypothetical protein
VHSLHIDAPAAENVPAGQSPLAAERAVPEQYLPEGQAVHDVWPARAWYWPAGHAAHEDDSAEKKEPAGHEAGVAVDGGAVERGEECDTAADVVDGAVVEAGVVAAVEAGAVLTGAFDVVVCATAVTVDVGAVERGEECETAADVVDGAVVEAGVIEAAEVVEAAVVAGEGCVPDTTDEFGSAKIPFPTIQLSNEIMSASASLRLYTSTD